MGVFFNVCMLINGVLFLDELPEFRRETLEVLRQPLEEGEITVARLQATYTYPARFMLLASMNPCPCGLLSDPGAVCACTPLQQQRYNHKISGPLLDRIDIFIEVPRLRYEEVTAIKPAEASRKIRKRVEEARQKQQQRFKEESLTCNAQMNPQHVQQHCALDGAGRELMRQAFNRLHLSARAYDRILKVARTIADLEGSSKVHARNLAEAISYRQAATGSNHEAALTV